MLQHVWWRRWLDLCFSLSSAKAAAEHWATGRTCRRHRSRQEASFRRMEIFLTNNQYTHKRFFIEFIKVFTSFLIYSFDVVMGLIIFCTYIAQLIINLNKSKFYLFYFSAIYFLSLKEKPESTRSDCSENVLWWW